MTPLILPPWSPELGLAPHNGDLTWAYPWPAGERLSRDLAEVVDCQGLRMAELGCGRGKTGLTALALGAARVTFCDIAREPLEYVQKALTANSFTTRGITCQHTWGEPIPGGPFAVILGADILYRPAFQAALLSSIAASLDPTGVALLADPRSELEPELVLLTAKLQLQLECIRRPGPYTLVRVTRTQ